MEDEKFRMQLESLFSGSEGPIIPKEDASMSLGVLTGDLQGSKQIQEQRDIFRILVENASDAISISNLEGCQTYNNRACYEIFGYDYDRQEMTGLPLASLWPEEDVDILVDHILPQALADNWSGEVRQRRRNGSLFDANLSISPVLDEAGHPINLAITIRDVSERKQRERKRTGIYEHRACQVQIITEVAQEIAAAPTLNELYRRVVTVIKERFGYYYVCIFRHDPELGVIVAKSCTRPGEGKSGATSHNLPDSRGVIEAAATTGQPILISDVSEDSAWEPHPDLPDTRGELVMPIKLRDQVLGVLDVHSDMVGDLTHEDEIVLLDLAGQIAIAIENVRLLEEASAFRQFAKAPEGVCWITLEGYIIIYANPALCTMLGAAKPEVTFGKPIMAYYPKELQERVNNQILPTVMREGQWVGELAFLSPQGRLTPTMQSIFLIRDESGNPLYLANVTTDITEQKHAEFLLDKRAKQINCLNDIGRKIEEKPQVAEFLQWVVGCIPPAMQYQDVCAVAVEFDNQFYGEPRAASLPCRIVEGLHIGDELAGKIYVSYTQDCDFTDAERVLVGDIARRVGGYIEGCRLSEQTRTTLDEVRATHRLYMPAQWSELASVQSAPAERVPQDDTSPDEDEPQDSSPDKRIGATLRETWQRISAGLLMLGASLWLGTLLTWTVKL
jgi:PAS domain S-box-containing protein